jgi:rhodanese-related sulfurtransferase
VVTAIAAPSTTAAPVTQGAPTVHWETRLFSDPTATRAPSSGRGWDAPTYAGIDDQLGDARSRLDRVSVRAAYQEVLYRRALLVDIRPAAQRLVEGEVAPHLGVLVVERNVLEWRFDPRHDARLDVAAFDARVLVLCQEGYTSSLAADALLRLGIHRATDVVGGFRAWREAGLPVAV